MSDALIPLPIVVSDLGAIVEQCKARGWMLHVGDGGEFTTNRLEPDGLELCRAVYSEPNTPEGASHDKLHGVGCQLVVRKPLLLEMKRLLATDENHDVSRIASKPVTRTFAYFDVSDFS